ncbi:hypothetical protein NEFER03_0174 [Nematocida sp. LUAm3]|nr:hypothetical protein NEFER03_0174 [Nematocida sp. LUAm3]KAI5173627.1 hypothetical protein NEFER02_0143 [Nematocida sp. LUAm2]KAI5176848.1 hypothetical protein NEFER01_0173 [Nematocida sp. LUAm1]
MIKESIWSSNEILSYILCTIGGYYAENTMSSSIRRRKKEEILSLISIQCLGYFLCFLFPLLSAAQRKGKTFLVRTRRRAKERKPENHQVKRGKLETQQSKVEKETVVEHSYGYYTERKEKIGILVLLALLGAINITNQIVLYRSLEYTTYTITQVVRLFRMIPISLTFSSSNPRISREGKVSIVLAVLGAFMYIFSSNERIEDIYLLKRLVKNNHTSALRTEDRTRIIRLFLRYLDYHAGDIPKIEEKQEKEFISDIINGISKRGNENISIKECTNKYYRGLLSLSKGEQSEVGEKTKRVFIYLQKKYPEKQEEESIKALSSSVLQIICQGKNAFMFKAFLEKDKISAGMHLALSSWLEVIFDLGVLILYRIYRIEEIYIRSGVNLLSSLFCWIYLFSSGFSSSFILRSITKDTFLSSACLEGAKLLMFHEIERKGLLFHIYLEIGKRFFSILLSVIFFKHGFYTGHCIGVLFMLVGCMVSLDSHSLLLSRWSNILSRKRHT